MFAHTFLTVDEEHAEAGDLACRGHLLRRVARHHERRVGPRAGPGQGIDGIPLSLSIRIV